MKVLIIEDSYLKQTQAKTILDEFNVESYEVVGCVMDVLLNMTSLDHDLIIADLGLPLRRGESVRNETEGYRMLCDLAFEKIEIPTIIFSSTELDEGKVEYLEDVEYPLLGQARDAKELRDQVQRFIAPDEDIKHGKVIN